MYEDQGQGSRSPRFKKCKNSSFQPSVRKGGPGQGHRGQLEVKVKVVGKGHKGQGQGHKGKDRWGKVKVVFEVLYPIDSQEVRRGRFH